MTGVSAMERGYDPRSMDVSIAAILTVAGVALAFSALDVLRKELAQGLAPMPLMVLMSLGSIPLFLAWVMWGGSWEIQSSYAIPGLASIGLNIIANLAFLQAVRVSPLSLTIPYLSLTPVFTTLLAIPILGERPTMAQVAGILLVVAGVFWLNVPRDGSVSAMAIGRALREEKGSLLMVLTAMCWSLAVPLDKLAVGASSWPLHALILLSGISAAGLLALASRGRLSQLKAERWGLVVAAVAVTAIGLALNLKALGMVWVGFIETLKRALGAALALIWGRLIFGEEIPSNRLLAVGLMGLGVGLILW